MRRAMAEECSPKTVTLYRERFKRLFDVTGASAALVLSAPILAVVSLLVRLTMGAPILFRQSRPGEHERIFTLLKFRSMREPDATRKSDSERMTRLGLFLRRTSLDELPQLINILRGEMSFIGPRPLAIQYLDYYSPIERRRHLVKPGIAGLAQVKGRNRISWEERFEHDVFYVDNVSFKLDFRIFLNAITSVLTSRDVHVRGSTTIEDFDKYRQSADNSKKETSSDLN